MHQNAKINNLFFLALCIIMFSSCNNSQKKYTVKQGAIDLSNVNFDQTKKIYLNGDWQFYWKQLPFEEEQLSIDQLQDPTLVTLPGGWIGNYFIGNDFPTKGYGTYRLQLKLGDYKEVLALKILRAHTAFEIWANGKKIEQLGVVGKNKSDARPKISPLIIDLPKTSEIDLIIPVSNYEYKTGGGFLQGISIGSQKNTRSAREHQLLIESLSAGVIFVVAVFSILFYFIESRRKVFLIFGVFVICGVLRQIVVGESVLISMFPELPFWIIHRLRFVPFYLGTGMAALYFYKLFPKELSGQVMLWYFRISVLFAIYVMIMPTYISSYAFIPYQFIAFFGIGYVIVGIIKALLRKRPEAKITLLAMGIMGSVMINDLLLVQQFIGGIFLVYYGFVAFIGMQVIVLFRTYKSYNKQITQLSEDLSTAGEQLQYKEEDITTLATDNAMRLQYKKQMLERIKEIQKQETTKLVFSLKKLSQEIRSQIQVEEKLSFQQEHMDLLNTEFNKRLLEQYPKLSNTEQEICGLIRLKMNTKEIATYRNTSDGAIRVAKNRIRKKISMTIGDDLESLMLDI